MCGREAWDPVKGLAVEGEKQRKESRFRTWHVGTLEAIAEAKEGQMATPRTLNYLMTEFPKALDREAAL
ncbi:hypothetical protein E4U31_002971 [Claviceps sp. LM219 group G6]|nr:hypothetical protein E4U31_002971 [Claviceps sp. LM219 group G6]